MRAFSPRPCLGRVTIFALVALLAGCGGAPGGAATGTTAPKPGAAAQTPATPGAPGTPGTPATPLPDARTLITEAIAASGGRNALLGGFVTASVSTRTQTLVGDVEGEAFYGAPDVFLIRRTMSSGSVFLMGSDGRIGWSQSAMDGSIKLLTQAEYDEARFDLTHFQTLPRLEERFRDIRTVESLTFADRPCYKVQLLDPTGTASYLYFDAESKLPRGAEIRARNALGTEDVRLYRYLEHAQYGPLTLWSKGEMDSHGRKQHTITVTDVAFDQVAPTIFELPEEVRALLGPGR
jgi:hypothetical protein